MFENKLNIKNRSEFRAWLKENSKTEKDCYIEVKRGKPVDSNHFWYIDAVEEALCFGWIDSTWKNIDGTMWTRFTKRRKNSLWTELNKERVRRLIRLGLMEKEGMEVLPDLSNNSFIFDEEIKNKLIEENALETFLSFPELYQRIRIYNVVFYRKKDKIQYQKSLDHLISQTKKNKMFGEWNDYGRLIEK